MTNTRKNFKIRTSERRGVVGAMLAATAIYVPCIHARECVAQSGVAARTITSNRVSLYEVPLVCPAAPQIGCGSASKPLLLELENNKVVSEAWLNRAGTIMAVLWSEQSNPRQRSRTISAILKQREVKAKELTGDAKERALKDFQSRSGWYRGAEVDRLSAEEAGVIAARLIGRFREKIALPEEKAKALQAAFTAQLKQQLTGQTTRDQTRGEMLKIARQHLDEKDVAVLVEAFGGGFRPQKNEK